MNRYSTAILLFLTISAAAQPKRARDLGVPLEGTPGPWNAITDVAGVEVGHTTLIEGPSIRTAVTVVWPRGKQSGDPAFGGWFSLNGNGEMTGTAWLEESGFVDGPILITNTHSVGTVRDAYIAWQVQHQRKPGTNSFGGGFWSLPIVAKTMMDSSTTPMGFTSSPRTCSRRWMAPHRAACRRATLAEAPG
jgi:D-aminopeptidase